MFIKGPRRKKFDGLVKSIWVSAHRAGVDEETLRDIVHEESNHQTRSTRALTRYEKLRILRKLRGQMPHLASKEQIWIIENVFLLRLGWTMQNFHSWLLGDQSPFRSHTQAKRVILNWPTETELEARIIKITHDEANRIIEGLKGSWRYVAGIVDVEKEKRRIIQMWRSARETKRA